MERAMAVYYDDIRHDGTIIARNRTTLVMADSPAYRHLQHHDRYVTSLTGGIRRIYRRAL